MTEPKPQSRRAKRRQRRVDMESLPVSSLERQMEINSRKLFVGALGRDTTAKDVFNYFKQFGEVEDVEIKMDDVTKRCRGFAFVIFKNKAIIDTIMSRNEHVIRGKTVDPKLCNMKPADMNFSTTSEPLTPNNPQYLPQQNQDPNYVAAMNILQYQNQLEYQNQLLTQIVQNQVYYGIQPYPMPMPPQNIQPSNITPPVFQMPQPQVTLNETIPLANLNLDDSVDEPKQTGTLDSEKGQ